MRKNGLVVKRLMSVIIMGFCLNGLLLSGAIGKTVLTVWTWNPSDQEMAMLEPAFEKDYPNIDLQFTVYGYMDYLVALKTGLPAGGGPDVLGTQVGAFQAEYAPFLENLEPYAIKAWGSNWKGQFYDVVIEQNYLAGGGKLLFGLPMNGQVSTSYYAKELFQKLGLKPPKTWDELVDVSKKLRAAGYDPMVQGATEGWTNLDVFMLLGNETAPGKFYEAEAGKTNWTDPGFVEAMDYWKKCFTDGVFQDGASGMTVYMECINKFVTQKAGMIQLGSWFMAQGWGDIRLEQAVGDFGSFDWPDVNGDGKPSDPIGGVDVAWTMVNYSKVKDAAWTWIRWITGENGNQMYLNWLHNLPARKGVMATTVPEIHKKDYQKFMNDLFIVRRREPLYPELKEALMDALSAVAVKIKSPKDALADVQMISEGIER